MKQDLTHFTNLYKLITNIIDYKVILITLVAFISLNSCSTVQKCPEILTEGNVSTPINTSNDELAPFIFENSFYYTNKNVKSNKFNMMIADYSKKGISNAHPFRNKTINKIEQAGLLKIHKNNLLKRTYGLFAGLSGNHQYSNSDIYFSLLINDEQPVSTYELPTINSDDFDSYPAISPDGSIIVFASSREGGYGGIDLYKSVKDESGKWSDPINLGREINSEGDEISPFINFDNSLLFASNSFSENGDFDIFSIVDDGNGNWSGKHKLPLPINTVHNEISPYIYGNDIYLSSDRPGGCGGYDIYKFQHCGDVILEGIVEAEEEGMPLNGKLYLLDINRTLIETVNIGANGKFNFNLPASNIYYIQYFNQCIPKYVPEQMIVAPCSDTNIVKISVRFILPSTSIKFDFANYKVPFFVSGYYQPNTPSTLSSLRLKFAYNMIGSDNSTKYIENPGEEYDDYAIIVENALNEVVTHIQKIIENTSNSECNKSEQSILIKVIGFADPRALSETSKYIEEDINDSNLDFYISKGEQLNNENLSVLRAYFTAKYLNATLKEKIDSKAFNSIIWQIEGQGIDETDKPNEQKRRVNIEIGLYN